MSTLFNPSESSSYGNAGGTVPYVICPNSVACSFFGNVENDRWVRRVPCHDVVPVNAVRLAQPCWPSYILVSDVKHEVDHKATLVCSAASP